MLSVLSTTKAPDPTSDQHVTACPSPVPILIFDEGNVDQGSKSADIYLDTTVAYARHQYMKYQPLSRRCKYYVHLHLESQMIPMWTNGSFSFTGPVVTLCTIQV